MRITEVAVVLTLLGIFLALAFYLTSQQGLADGGKWSEPTTPF